MSRDHFKLCRQTVGSLKMVPSGGTSCRFDFLVPASEPSKLRPCSSSTHTVDSLLRECLHRRRCPFPRSAAVALPGKRPQAPALSRHGERVHGRQQNPNSRKPSSRLHPPVPQRQLQFTELFPPASAPASSFYGPYNSRIASASGREEALRRLLVATRPVAVL